MIKNLANGIAIHFTTLRAVYCSNLSPSFSVPVNHKPRTPFQQRCLSMLRKRKVADWVGFRVVPPIDPKTLNPLPPRQRALNEHRARALQSMMEAMIHHLNIITGVVHCTVEKLAEYCGLDTVSEAGNRSITRASRCIQQMECFGLLQCEREWNAALGIWYPKIIQVTPLFFQSIEIPQEDWEAAIRQQEGYQRQGLANAQEQLSIEEARLRQIAQLKEIYLRQRQARQEIKRARKLQQLTLQKQRSEISKSIIKALSQIELIHLGVQGVQKLVNQKMMEFKRLLSHSPPT
ncbi:MAG: plasmid replication initiator RepA (plasmid) [Candidatus Symbiodolus clandestinus]